MDLSRSSRTPGNDPLSDVLLAFRAGSAGRTRLEASGDWALDFPAVPRLKFVALVRGTCWVIPHGEPAHRMATDDVVLLGNTAYSVASDPAIPPVDGTALYEESGSGAVRLGGGDTVLVGGSIAFTHAGTGFVLDALPPFLFIAGSLPAAAAIARTLALLDAEAARAQPGGALVAMRLAEVLLVEAIRIYIADHGRSQVGWIGALGDRRIGEALGSMHGDPAHPWTVASLASHVGMSRSAFSARFSGLIGQPPLEYLRHWRMVLARQLLDEDGQHVGNVAGKVGYTSQSAFGNAFKRSFGYTPRSKSARGIF